MDLSLVFLEKSLRLASPRARIAFICTSQWLTVDYGRNLRGMLRDGRLHSIVDFGSLPVFASASTYPAIFVLSPTPTSELSLRRITDSAQLNLAAIEHAPATSIPLASLTEGPWNLSAFDIMRTLARNGLPWKPLREIGRAYIGCKTGMNEAFVLTKKEARDRRLERGILFPYAYQGQEIERYTSAEPDAVVIYPYREGEDGSPELIPETTLKREYPRVHDYLLSFKGELRKRQDSRRLYADGPEWYRHLRAGSFRYIRPKKLVFKAISKASCGGLLEGGTAFDGANCPAIIPANLAGHDIKYILAILNSGLATNHLRSVCPPKLSGYVKFSATCLSDMPIRILRKTDRAEWSRHDHLVELVNRMFALTQKRSAVRTPHDEASLVREAAATEAEIDRIVYDLYGLSSEEIRTVEEATRV